MDVDIVHWNGDTHMKHVKFIKKNRVMNDDCCICLQPLQSNTEHTPECGVVVKLACGHEFHNGCINNWLETITTNNRLSCPLCRTTIHTDDAITCWAFQHRCLTGQHLFLTKEYTGETV